MFSSLIDISNRDYNYFDFLFENDFKTILPEFFLVISLFVMLLYALSVVITTPKHDVLLEDKVVRKQSLQLPLIFLNLSALAVISFVSCLVLTLNNPISKASLFYNTFQIDDFRFFFKVLLIGASLFSIIISLEYEKQENLNQFELVILSVIASISMLFLISADDFISIYLAIELQSLCFYVMAAIKRDSEFSTEAGLKYFLLGAFSSGIFLLGCSLIYGFTGTTNFEQLTKIFPCNYSTCLNIDQSGQFLSNFDSFNSFRACELGMLFILIAFLFKLTSVPFHIWAPDVYEGAPLSVTAFFAIVPKISILAVLIKLCFETFYDLILPWQKMLILSSIASMLLGALTALSQNKIKRLLAWSSIAHVGYLLIGICSGTLSGIEALLFYLVIYLVMTINLFSIVMSPLRRQQTVLLNEPGQSKVERLKYVTDFAFCSQINPIIALTCTITLFSIAGIPPLAGFFSKAFVMFAAISAQHYVLAFVALFSSVISCFFYIRIVKIAYFEKLDYFFTFMQSAKANSIALGISFAFLLFFVFNPTPLFSATHQVALHLAF